MSRAMIVADHGFRRGPDRQSGDTRKLCRASLVDGTGTGIDHRPMSHHPSYAAMNSFHFWTMYRSSFITEFQHATWPIRSVNEPPSRTAPAFSITLPSGLRI